MQILYDCRKAGSPTDPNVYWIHFKPKEIATLFLEETGNNVSNNLVKRTEL